MFSLWQMSFHGFLQCSIFFPHTHFDVFAFKAVAETYFWFRGGVSESKTYRASFRLVTCELIVFKLIFAIVTASLLIQLVFIPLIYCYLLLRRLKFRDRAYSGHTPFLCKSRRFSRLWFPCLSWQFSNTTSFTHIRIGTIVSLIYDVTGGLCSL